ncbi:unnamed protein product [Gemmataceae bacterium]|nr:unnamed protein product [Gemmataceae bacterium]VTU02024.1 unnamed protein product [Gemmataceae bacterium]
MTESKVVNAWIAQGEAKGRATGRVEGRAEMLLDLLADTFGAVPPDLEARVRATTAEDRLRAWAGAAVRAGSLAAFRQQVGL